MATTRLMATVLPYSVDPADPFHVSVFISHRLGDGGTLVDYPAMVNWVKTLKAATITLRSAEAGATPIPCTAQLGKTSESAWETAFPPDTAVVDYPEPKPSGQDWKSFPANRIPDHVLDVHHASALWSPIDRPRSVGNPLADGLLDVFGTLKGVDEVVDELRGYDRCRTNQRARLKAERAQAAREALAPKKPEPEPPPPPPGPAVVRAVPQENDADRPCRSPIETLIGGEGTTTDAAITSYLNNRILEPGPQAAPDDPMLTMLTDLHCANRFYLREEEQVAARPTPDPQARLARTEHDPPDFHERVAAACNVPALARKLGLVVDVMVADLTKLTQATRVWCDITVEDADAEVEKYISPETHCVVTGSRFLARAKDTNRWNAGRLRLGDAERYRVMDLDPDAGALALEQWARSAIRALAIELNGDKGSFAPAGLRSTGFAVAELARSDRLRDQVEKSEVLQPVVETGGAQPRVGLFFEGLLRGLRLEVWDDVTNRWHSLHQRLVTGSFTDTPILVGVDDPGLLQNPPLNRTPGNPNNPYYVHEVLAGYDGWSLSAPRPGKLLIHNNADHPEPGRERIEDTPESKPGLWVRSTVKPGTLPALRYGRRYSFRIAGVDLAGNSVPMAAVPPATVPHALIDKAAACLDRLQAEAKIRQDAGLLSSLRSDGSLIPAVTDGNGTRSLIEQATASVVKNATSLRRYPQWEVTLEQLAKLFADAGDPTTVTAPQLFLRWDPIPAPTLVPRSDYTRGESLQRMVIRTRLDSGPGLCERHVAPPKGSQLEAEQDGRFDQLMAAGEKARAYAIALKERGRLFDKYIQDLNDPHGTRPQPGIALKAMPNAVDLKTLDQIQDREEMPGTGQYITHNVEQLVLPYLPDPMARGVALVFYEAGAGHRLSNPRVLQSVTIDYRGRWPEIEPLRLVLHNSDRLDARQDGNVIRVGLPPGEQVAVTYATTLDAGHLAKMGLWQFHPANDKNVPPADRLALERAAMDGWMWWLTPDEELRLVHATARPAVPPKISRLKAQDRNPLVVTLNLDGVLDVHGASTDRVELRANRTEPVDDPTAPAPTEATTTEIVTDFQIDQAERESLMTVNESADRVGTRKVEVPIRPVIHTLPDTRARTVRYRLYGSSRYREFFLPDELPAQDDPLSMGNEVAVNVRSSAQPAPPVVRDVIPMFLWEQATEPEHPFAVRRVRRSGVRIWLERPWYSSGAGEMLAVLTTGDAGLAAGRPETVSLWARDPIIAGPKIANSHEVPVLSAAQQRAVQLGLAPENLPARPVRHAVVRPPGSGLPTDHDKMINAYGFIPEFHPERRKWFVDVVLESARSAWPFLRLALARYQPNSIPGKEFSEIVPTDFVQIPPERIGTLSRPDTNRVRITVTGTSPVTNAPGVQVPTTSPDQATLLDLITKTHTVIATVQTRNKVSGSDIDWLEGAPAVCRLGGVDAATFTATWTAELDLLPPQPLTTPPASEDLRVQVEEYEVLSADPRPGETALTPARRLVYADHFYL
jgi:hypothetical protein